MKRKIFRSGIYYLKRRPISLILLALSGLLAVQCASSIGQGTGLQIGRDIMFVLFFPMNMILFVRKWRAFVVANTVALCMLLGISIFVMIRYVDPLMGGCYVAIILVLTGLLLREFHRLRHMGTA